MSYHNKFVVGDFHSRKTILDIIEEPTLSSNREGIFYCKSSLTIILFTDLDKTHKKEQFIYRQKINREKAEQQFLILFLIIASFLLLAILYLYFQKRKKNTEVCEGVKIKNIHSNWIFSNSHHHQA